MVGSLKGFPNIYGKQGTLNRPGFLLEHMFLMIAFLNDKKMFYA